MPRASWLRASHSSFNFLAFCALILSLPLSSACPTYHVTISHRCRIAFYSLDTENFRRAFCWLQTLQSQNKISEHWVEGRFDVFLSQNRTKQEFVFIAVICLNWITFSNVMMVRTLEVRTRSHESTENLSARSCLSWASTWLKWEIIIIHYYCLQQNVIGFFFSPTWKWFQCHFELNFLNHVAANVSLSEDDTRIV